MMKIEQLKEVLELHKKWLDNEKDGVRANLRGADLRGANLSVADLRGANLYGADLRGADLYGADLRGADLRGADLRGADLRGADLRGADLYGADLRGADLSVADLRGANLRGADLYGAKYGDVILKGTPFQIYTNIYYVLIFHEHIKIGCEFHSTKEWENFTDKEILAMDGKKALSFWKKWKATILQMAKLRNL